MNDEELTTADQTVRRMVAKANMLKDYSYTPRNVVLITVDDIVEITREVVPYTMSKLDELHSEVAMASRDQQIALAAQEREAKLLNALGLMYGQYCSKPMGHDFMGAGEAAIEVLEDYGIHNEDLEWTDESYDKLEAVVATLHQPQGNTLNEGESSDERH